MAEEQQREDREPAEEEHREEPVPFDANPPINPSEPQVGNANAVFFMPREEGAEEAEEESEDEPEEGEGQHGA